MTRPLCVIALALVVLVGCDGQTEPATDVGTTVATLEAFGHCDQDDEGDIYWEYRPVGGSTWTRVFEGPVLPSDSAPDGHDPCPSRLPASGESSFEYDATGLTPDTLYEYRILFHFQSGSEAWGDSDGGAANGTNYDTFRTLQTCDRTVSSGTSFATATSGLPANADLCLGAGSYTWGSYTPPTGISIHAQPGVDATVTGEARVTNPDVTLENLTLKGASGETAVVVVEDDDFIGERLEIDTDHQVNVQGILVGNGGVQPANTQIRDTVIHGARGNGQCFTGAGFHDGQVHAIYWANGVGGVITRVWMYDLGGFGLHFYSGVGGSAALTNVSRTVTDDTLCGLGNVVDDITASAAIFTKTITTDAGPWSCQVTSGYSVTNSRSQDGFLSCPNQSGNTTADTTYQNEGARDYRVPGNADHQFIPGPQ